VDDQPGYVVGIRAPDWTHIHKLKDGETTDNFFACLACEPNDEVEPIHPKAMPVTLTETEESSGRSGTACLKFCGRAGPWMAPSVPAGGA
jgi:hypothetical protein